MILIINKFRSLILLGLLVSQQVKAESLSELIQIAISAHPSVQAQKSQSDLAKSEREIAQQQFLPTPSINLEQNLTSNTNRSLYKGDDAQLVLRLQQPLWTGGRLTSGLSKAEAQVQVSLYSVEEVRQQIALRTVQAWSDWYGAELKIQAMAKSVETHQRLQNQVKRRVELGASAPAELILTESRVAQSISMLQAYQAMAGAAKVRIVQLVGNTIDAELPTGDSLQNYEYGNLESLQAKIQTNNPSIKKLQAQLAVQAREIEVRKSELMPDVYLRAEHQQGNYFYNNAPDTNLLFLGISTKFGAGLSSFGKIDSAQKQQESINSELEATERNIIEQIQSDWIQLLSLQSRLPFLEESLLSTKATADAWDRQFLAGKKSWLEVMNTTRELAQAELELADAKAGLIATQWRLVLLTDGVDLAIAAASRSAKHAKDI